MLVCNKSGLTKEYIGKTISTYIFTVWLLVIYPSRIPNLSVKHVFVANKKDRIYAFLLVELSVNTLLK